MIQLALMLLDPLPTDKTSCPFTHRHLFSFTMYKSLATAAALVVACGASPLSALKVRQAACAPIHIFGARETTVSPGYGTAGMTPRLLLDAYSSLGDVG